MEEEISSRMLTDDIGRTGREEEQEQEVPVFKGAEKKAGDPAEKEQGQSWRVRLTLGVQDGLGEGHTEKEPIRAEEGVSFPVPYPGRMPVSPGHSGCLGGLHGRVDSPSPYSKSYLEGRSEWARKRAGGQFLVT